MTLGDTVPAAGRPAVGAVVRAPKTGEVIAAQLRARIVTGDLKTGDSLPPESQLMEQFGVSRPTLREAFRILEFEGLLTVRRGSRGGAKVSQPDVTVAARYVGLLLQIQGATIADVYDARMVIEPPAVRMLARSHTPEDLQDLRDCVDALRSVVAAGRDKVPDPTRWSQLTYRFHEIILQRCGSNTLALQGAVLQDLVATHLAVTVRRTFDSSETPARFRRTIKSYDKLIDLMAGGDAGAAEAHWRTHMQVAGKALLRDDLENDKIVDLFAAT